MKIVISQQMPHQEKSFFIVGDYKQSIYSFQGANADLFEKMRQWFSENIANWQEINLEQSFRSTPSVLKVVDSFLQHHPKGLVFSDQKVIHKPFRINAAGTVTLWQPVQSPTLYDIPPWFIPTENLPSKDPEKSLAEFLVKQIIKILQSNQPLPSTKNPPQAGDILILIRNRGKIMGYLNNLLKANDIPVAGSDKMLLNQELAVKDLLALGHFINLPEDDYNLACLLKTPLINDGQGINEEELYQVTWGRSNSVWEQIKNLSQESEFWQKIYQNLQLLIHYWHSNNLYNFYVNIVSYTQSFFIKRLGAEVQDILECFLEQTYTFMQKNGSNLYLFLQYWQNHNVTVKRTINNYNQVRIMTTHGAKGLQSPIVIIADNQNVPTLRQEDLLLLTYNQKDLFILRPSENKDCSTTKKLKIEHLNNMQNEHRRLLYVALTRAQDHLYIAAMTHNPQPESWYDLIYQVMQNMDCVDKDEAITYNCSQDAENNIIDTHKNFMENCDTASLSNINNNLLAVTNNPFISTNNQYFIPKQTFLKEHTTQGGLPQNSNYKSSAMNYGIMLHEILEILPYLPQDKWIEFIDRYKLDKKYVDNLMAILNDSQFHFLFLPQSVSEAKVVDQDNKIIGRIDRLSIEPPYLYLVDFKSGKSREKSIAKYRQQLYKYTQALKNIYPNFIIKKFILWLEELEIMEID